MGKIIILSAAKLAEALKILIPFASTDGMLPSLCAVRFVVGNQGDLTLAASNRYVLGEFKVNSDDVTASEESTFSLPIEAAKDWVRFAKNAAKSRTGSPNVEIEARDEGGKVTLVSTISGDSLTSATEQSDWINSWQRLFPTEFGELGEIGFTTSTIAVFAKAFRDDVLVLQFGETPHKAITVTVPSAEEFRALIMPVRLADE